MKFLPGPPQPPTGASVCPFQLVWEIWRPKHCPELPKTFDAKPTISVVSRGSLFCLALVAFADWPGRRLTALRNTLPTKRGVLVGDKVHPLVLSMSSRRFSRPQTTSELK